jgi:hypothetical protein
MNASSKRGNDPERWEALLTALDDKLQLGLLEHLKRVNSYHFEESILYVECADVKDHAYLSKDAVLQQLRLLAEDSIKIEAVKIKKLC